MSLNALPHLKLLQLTTPAKSDNVNELKTQSTDKTPANDESKDVNSNTSAVARSNVTVSSSGSSAVAQLAVSSGNRSSSSRSHSRPSNKNECTFSTANSLPNMIMNERVANYIYTHRTTTVFPNYITSSVTVPVFTATSFELNADVIDYTSLTALFDQYRLQKVEVWLVPRIGPAQISASANTGLLVSAVDYDDLTLWSTFAQGLEFRNAIVSEGSNGHYRCFKPHIAAAVYSGAFTSFANISPNTWIDCNSPSVIYYGLKTAITVTDSVYIYDSIVRSTWQFRNSR